MPKTLDSTEKHKTAIELELNSLLKIANARITVLEKERLSFVGEKADVEYCNKLRIKFDEVNNELS